MRPFPDAHWTYLESLADTISKMDYKSNQKLTFLVEFIW